MLILIYYWKNLLIDFIKSFIIFINWRGETYNLILIIFNQLIIMIYFKPSKIIIDILKLAKNI